MKSPSLSEPEEAPGLMRMTICACTMLFGKPMKRWPSSVSVAGLSKPFQNGKPENAVSMQALLGEGSTPPAKLSGKPAVNVAVGGPARTLFTLTLNEQDDLLPQPSVAVQVTTVVPTGKLPPL